MPGRRTGRGRASSGTLDGVWTWRFDPDSFAHVWRETGVEAHPYPVRLLETPATREQARTLRDQLAQRLPPGSDADLSAALNILAAPRARVIVIGNGPAPGSEIRMLGCVVRQRAVLVVQEPGPTSDYGGVVHVSMGHAARLGHRLAARLPPVRAGREPWRAAMTTALRDVNPGTEPEDWDLDSEVGQILTLLHRPRAGEGHVRVEPRTDRHYPQEPTDFTWIDVVDDGRYLVKPGVVLHIGPGPAETIATQIQRLLPRAR